MFEELSGSSFLHAWHARFAGGTARHYASGRVAGSDVSTYGLLVDDVAALSSGKTVVDIACGDGYLLQLISERFPQATLVGVDASSEEIRLALERVYPGDVRFEERPVEDLPFPTGSIDAVVCHMAFMLFDDARTVTKEIARVLRPGAMFAAIFGPARGTGPGIRGFGGKLHEIESNERLARLDVGDSATDTEETSRALFESDDWQSVELRNVALRFETAQEVREMLLSMYNIARLSQSGRAELEDYVRSALRDSFDPADWQLGLRHLVAERIQAEH
ncbi:MAG TPA: class I SAM-dependent methyltransferase [Candidatus Tumulicola sp.]|jgi:ubiquinone/menaquinone biosynthesis C-methylase UbiE